MRHDPSPRLLGSLSGLALALALALALPAAAAKRALLVYGGDAADAAGNARDVLEARGFDVDSSLNQVPADLAPYCCVWDIRPFDPLFDFELDRYRDFVDQGHGLILFGENRDCCTGRNLTIQDFLVNYVDAGNVVIDDVNQLLGDFTITTNSHACTRSPSFVGLVNYDGFGAGVFDDVGRGTHLTPQNFIPGEISAVAFDEGDLHDAPSGRVVVVLDVNWLDSGHFNNADNAEFAENISHFLCPSTNGSDLDVAITAPAGYQLECPAMISIAGIVTGGIDDCAQPTDPPAPPRLHPAGAAGGGPGLTSGVRITRIDYRINGGSFQPVDSTTPALPADTPVQFVASGISPPFGNSTIQVRARDASGRNVFTQISGSLTDNLPPEIDDMTCQDETVDLGASCTLDYTGVPVAFDLCDPVIDFTGAPPLPVTFNGPGSVAITYTARDDAGNVDMCSRIVTAIDLSPPVLTCAPATTIECAATGGTPASDAAAQAFLAATTAVDNCSNPPSLVNDAPGFFLSGCLPGHDTTVTWTSSDSSQHTATCSAVLTVADRTAPQLTSVPDPLSLECSAQGGVPGSAPALQAWLTGFAAADLCAPTVTLGNDLPMLVPYDCGQTPTTVHFTAGDGCGNQASADRTVHVLDTVPPALTPPPPLDLECSGPGGIPASNPVFATWLATASDLCHLAASTRQLPAFFFSGCGAGQATVVPFSATDGCGNVAGATQTVTVHDRVGPALSVPLDLTIECTGAPGVPVGDARIQQWLAQAAAMDVCDVGSPNLSNDAPPVFPGSCAGSSTVVTFRAVDDCGNQTLRTATLTVVDSSAPTLTVPPQPLTLECRAQGGVPRTDPDVQAWLAQASGSDACGGVTVSNDAPLLILADCGSGRTTTVTFEARDDCGHVTRATSTITVRDTTAPDLTPPPATTVQCTAQGGIPRSDAQVQAWLALTQSSDVCGTAHVTDTAPIFFPGTCAGTTTSVTFTSVDDCANAATASAGLTVADTVGPVLTLPPPLVLACNAPGGVPSTDPQILAWLAQASAADLCSTASLTHVAPAVFPSGCGQGSVTTVTFTASDGCGNVTTGTSTVTVADVTPPALQVPGPITLECNGQGGVPGTDPQILAWLAQAAASDVCGAASLGNDAPPLFLSGCGPGSVTTVTFTAIDTCGNAATATSTVTVADTTPPSLAVPAPLVLECRAQGGVPGSDPQVQAWLATASGSDVCSGVTIGNDAPAVFPAGCAPGDTTTVTFTAEDSCANLTTGSSTVTVADTTPPELAGCALEPWDLVIAGPRPPQPPSSPASCASSGAFRVRCGAASDLCDSQPVTTSAEIRVRSHDVVNGACVLREDLVTVACDEVIELRLLAPPCPSARPPRPPRPPVSVTSTGLRVISGEHVELDVTASDGCGNRSAACTVDPVTAPDPGNPGRTLLCAPLPPRSPRCATSRCGV